MRTAISELVEQESYYYIDYIPHNPTSPEYLELEAYYIKTYLSTFADKISRIILQLIWEYPCHVCLGEMTKQTEKYSQISPFTDLRHHSPEYLANMIKNVIQEDFSYLSVLLLDKQTLINIGGEFHVVLYQPSDEMIIFTKMLCQAEGLFLKYKSEDGSRRLV